MMDWQSVTTSLALSRALEAGAKSIEIAGEISGMPMITLGPGVRVRGGTLRFGAKGVRLTRDNVLEDVIIRTSEHEVAILNDTSVADVGTLTLSGVRTTGQVSLVARGAARAGRVKVNGLTVEEADVRGRVERPRGFGVEALQGGFTLWNMQADAAVEITAELLDVAAGRAAAPARGAAVFVGGYSDWNGNTDGGTVRVSLLRAGNIHANGGIAAGTPDLISGGVFVISGASVHEVVNAGAVTTYGANDMVKQFLD